MNDLREPKKAQTMVWWRKRGQAMSPIHRRRASQRRGLAFYAIIVALRKLNKLIESAGRIRAHAASQRSASSALPCAAAWLAQCDFVLSVVPMVLEMMESGDYAGAVTDAGRRAGSTSTWG